MLVHTLKIFLHTYISTNLFLGWRWELQVHGTGHEPSSSLAFSRAEILFSSSDLDSHTAATAAATVVALIAKKTAVWPGFCQPTHSSHSQAFLADIAFKFTQWIENNAVILYTITKPNARNIQKSTLEALRGETRSSKKACKDHAKPLPSQFRILRDYLLSSVWKQSRERAREIHVESVWCVGRLCHTSNACFCPRLSYAWEESYSLLSTVDWGKNWVSIG